MNFGKVGFGMIFKHFCVASLQWIIIMIESLSPYFGYYSNFDKKKKKLVWKMFDNFCKKIAEIRMNKNIIVLSKKYGQGSWFGPGFV